MRVIFILTGIFVVIAIAVLLAVKMLQMDSNLSTSIRLAQELKTQVSTLGKENFDYREQLRGYGSKNDELEKERSRLIRQLTEAQSKQVHLEAIAMDQATRVKELESVSESLKTREAELSEKDQQLRSLMQELEVVRSEAKAMPVEGDSVKETGSVRVSGEAPTEKSVIPIWNSRSGAVEELDIRGVPEDEVCKKLSEAIVDLQRAEKEGRPSDPGFMAGMFYNLGVVSTHSGDYRRAVDSFNSALALRSEDADSHYNLAIVYDEKLHDDAMALKHYSEYLRLKPNAPEFMKIRKWIIDKEAAVMINGGK